MVQFVSNSTIQHNQIIVVQRQERPASSFFIEARVTIIYDICSNFQNIKLVLIIFVPFEMQDYPNFHDWILLNPSNLYREKTYWKLQDAGIEPRPPTKQVILCSVASLATGTLVRIWIMMKCRCDAVVWKSNYT